MHCFDSCHAIFGDDIAITQRVTCGQQFWGADKKNEHSKCFDQSLTFKYAPNFLKGRSDISRGESNLTKPVDIAELLAAVLKQNYSPRETKTTLKQSSLVNDIHAGLHGTIRSLILRGHH